MVAEKDRGDFFQGGGGCSFYIKNKLKSEIFNPNLGVRGGGGGWGVFFWFSLNNAKTVKAVTLEFCSIQ